MIFKEILKYKKLILAAFLPLSFWAGVFAFWFYGTGTSNAEPIVLKSPQNKISDSISQIASIGAVRADNDNDGLSDWEESIYGTNPSNPDSDGDGYLDGEEILSSHNPLKKGPDDIISKNNSGVEDKTAAGKLTKLAIENYLKTSRNQDLASLTPEQASQVISQLFDSKNVSEEFKDILKSELYYFIPPNINKDVEIAEDDSEKYQKKYWEDIRNLLLNIKENGPSNDFAFVISESMQTKNFQELDKFITFYKNNYEKTKNIVVAPSFISNHKNLLTYFYKSQKISEAIKNYEQDPTRSLLALNELTKIFNDTQKAFSK